MISRALRALSGTKALSVRNTGNSFCAQVSFPEERTTDWPLELFPSSVTCRAQEPMNTRRNSERSGK